ncbi:hypothetical protein O179_00600 [Chlamydia trachomatis]|nr:hypothetical protein E150_00595 [Chlamydia trachomatis E/150]ADH20571.1 hypothetical protein E11023_00585 [Chlamydia trachomatis E/11023]AEJ77205.1 hypothetical protein CTL2C_285 [Chlamydia trachomatis L2c]AGJ64467.1 hypothetical protein CTLINITIAL_01935 [Chlamydia trachomatis L2/434/Bu(i)]AGJ65407.1 hypothetical protein CTLFINAL_01935 [Chlamydia trachomatis L2/434/Bu(f)]AGR93529.1 hypothetical protein CTRC69_00590 [Chlamydia trachomatis RC-F/69]AGR94451.1 hypothetical protein CTRC46_00590
MIETALFDQETANSLLLTGYPNQGADDLADTSINSFL